MDLNQKFQHFMLQEIHEQPALVEAFLKTHLTDLGKTPIASEILLSSDRTLPLQPDFDSSRGIPQAIRILACGSSLHAGMVGQYLLEQLTGIPTLAQSATDYSDRPLPLPPGTLLISVTQSGETADTLEALQKARQLDHQNCSAYLGITNQSGSSLEKWVDRSLYTGAGKEIAVAATKTFLTELLAFYRLALELALQKQTLTPETLQILVEELKQVPAWIAKVLEQQSSFIQDLAPILAKAQSCVCLGRGLHFPIALEGALKLKETSYLHSEGFMAGEFMHGPVAMLDETTPVIAIVVPGSCAEKMLDNLKKVKMRGAFLIGITSEGLPNASSLFDEIIQLPSMDERISPLLTVVPLQLLAYYTSVQRGLDVDHPRSLQKFIGEDPNPSRNTVIPI